MAMYGVIISHMISCIAFPKRLYCRHNKDYCERVLPKEQRIEICFFAILCKFKNIDAKIMGFIVLDFIKNNEKE